MIYEFFTYSNYDYNITLPHIQESLAGGVDKIYISYSDKSFRYKRRETKFPEYLRNYRDKIEIFYVDGKKYLKRKDSKYNMRVVKSLAAATINIRKDDILLMSDADEIIYRQNFPYFLDKIRENGCQIAKLLGTEFYLNGFFRTLYHFLGVTGEYYISKKESCEDEKILLNLLIKESLDKIKKSSILHKTLGAHHSNLAPPDLLFKTKVGNVHDNTKHIKNAKILKRLKMKGSAFVKGHHKKKGINDLPLDFNYIKKSQLCKAIQENKRLMELYWKK